jgi:hypothetical protein
MQMRQKVLAALAVSLVVSAFAPAASAVTPRSQLEPDDWDAPVVADTSGVYTTADTTQGLFDGDPTGLVPKTPFVQRYSLDQDHWEVWLCGSVTHTMPQVIAALDAATVDYYDSISGGVYEPIFTAGGTKPLDDTCLDGFLNGTYSPVGSPEGLLVIDSVTGGGYASPGTICISNDPDCTWIGSTFPDNYRYAVVGEDSAMNWPSVTAHELGHTLQWPHSNSGAGDEYDNPIDLMSGNNTTGGWTEADPYATLSYNRFQSGWVSTGDVVVADGNYQAVTLRPHNVAGTQLFAIKTAQSGRFYVFGARITSTYDPIPSAWQGVEVYQVDYYCDDGVFSGGICPGIYRDQTQQPPSHDGVGHVLQLGDSVTLEGLTVTVTAATATGYTITSDPDPGVDTEPSAPGAPTVTAGDESVSLSWTAAGNGGSAILNYDVEVENRDGGGSNITDVGVTLATTITGLSNGTTYRARARATNAIGDGPWSTWSADFTPGTVPSAPGVPTVDGGNAVIGASWSAPGGDGGANVTNYELQVNDITAATYDYLDAGTGLSEDVTGLTNGHTYRIRVRAENGFGVGAWSGWSAQVTLVWTPSAPQQPTITVTAIGEVTAAWSAPLDDGGTVVTGYEVALENTTGVGTVAYHPGTATTINITGLSEADTYRYRVRAGNSEGWGAWSAWSPDFVPGLVPSAPGVPTVSAGDGQMAVAWAASGGVGSAVDTYQLELEDVSGGSPVTVAVGGTTLSRAFTGLVNGDDYRVRVRAHNDSGWGPWSAWSETATPQVANTFIDDEGSVFEADIEWLAAEGVTRGCNPPANDMFCPNDAVTRGQMAAFLVRALGLTDQLTDPFIDDDGSVFEANIERLAAAGITRGCNPPANDRFCPNAPVTRGQMAAFLVRALGYTDTGVGDLFMDDDGTVFETDIDRLATAGVTRGCNPPANDKFCPTAVVTRAQMAAFLHRALG